MSPSLHVRAERFALRSAFRISRGAKTHAEVVVAELSEAGATGRGEGVPYARYGETVASVVRQLEGAAGGLAAGASLDEVAAELPPGAAANAFDCASWDLRARRLGRSVADALGRPRPGPMTTAVTIALDRPEAMAAAAAAVAGAPLLKVKLDAHRPAERLQAVAAAAPAARLIVDANEGWTLEILEAMADVVARLNVAMVEQPLPAGGDGALRGLAFPVPLCADESAHTARDVAGLADRYQAVNVKLDKAGGLTGALAMVDRAREAGLAVLAGCMVCSSLSVAPAMLVASQADAVDLDGPWWLAEDRPGGCRIEQGRLWPPQPGFWGEAERPAVT